MEVGKVEPDTDGLPFGVVKVGAEEDAFPSVEQAGMQIQLSVEQLQAIVGLALSDSQQPTWKSGAEAEAQIVAFVPIRLDGNKGRAVEAHGGGVLAQLSVEAKRTLAGKPMDRLIFEEWLASAAVQTRDIDAAQ